MAGLDLLLGESHVRGAACIALVGLGLTGCATTMASTTNTGVPVRTTLSSQYDRIKDVTEVFTLVFLRTGGMMGHPVELDLRAQHAGVHLRQPIAGVFLVFKSSSGTATEGWQFLRNHELALLVDGSVRLTLQGVRDSDVGAVLLHENIGFIMPTADVLRLGNARTVEGRLGEWSFALTTEEISKIREMALFASMAPDAPRPFRGRER